MIERLIISALKHRLMVLCGLVFLIGWGVWTAWRTPIDAIPDLSENQLVVFADWPGRSPQEVENQLTYPISVGLQGLTGVRTIRASSMLGFSFVTVIFEEGVDRYFARARVLERLNQFRDNLPAGVEARLGPDASGLGWVYQYYLHVDPVASPGGGYDLASLRTLQDVFIRQQLSAVSGVAEVGSIGGFVQQYQIEASPLRMRARGITLADILEAVKQSNLNVAGKVIEESGQEFVIRGVGAIQTLTDLEWIVLKEVEGGTVLLRDVATVQRGGEFRRGVLDVDGREVVGGTVVMRHGENARAVIDRVKAKLKQMAASLPPGVSIRPFYDRSTLIQRAVDTLKWSLLEAVLLVALVHVLFLGHVRSILIVTLPLPIAILIAFILMERFGISANIMSLSGIAIAIGVLVDAGIVVTENVLRHCERAEASARLQGGASDGRLSPEQTLSITAVAASQIGRPVVFAMGIILLAFAPVFGLVGEEGRLFGPLAFTKTFAMAAATVLSVTLVPILCSFWMKGPYRSEGDHWVMRRLLHGYGPVLKWALERRRTVVVTSALLLLGSMLLALGLPAAGLERLRGWGGDRLADRLTGLGSEFMPTLNEGSLLFMPTLLPSTPLTDAKRILSWQNATLKQVPEVQSVGGKLGRAETATDPAPTEMIETIIELKPQSEWRPGMTREKLVAELMELMSQVPGCVPGFLQPIEGRLLMLNSGIRSQVGVVVLGDSLESLQTKALEVEAVLRSVPGAAAVATSRSLSKPHVQVVMDREAMARQGVRAAAALEAIEVGVGGLNVGTVLAKRERFPIQLRWERSVREDIETLGSAPVSSVSGRVVSLGQVARIHRTMGPSEIGSENGRLKVVVQANVRDRNLAEFVEEAQLAVSQRVVLSPGMTLEWSGTHEQQKRAQRRLSGLVPIVVIVIFVLLWVLNRSAKEAAHILLAVPFALTGGFLLQWWMGYPFSVAVWVGYIALFGIATQTAVVMVVYLNEALDRNRQARGRALDLEQVHAAVMEGAVLRLRPKLMTVVTTVASLLPLLWSSSTGSEILRPLAVPVLGGMVSSFFHILIVTPVLVAWLHEPRTEALTETVLTPSVPVLPALMS